MTSLYRTTAPVRSRDDGTAPATPRDGGTAPSPPVTRTVGAVAALVVALVVLLSGCAGGLTVAGAPSAERAGSQPLGRSLPAEITIPRIDARSSLVELGLNPDDTVEVPPVTEPMQAGWYGLGPTPGEAGPAVILGHVDGNRQPGIFYRLKELQAGDEILVGRADGTTAVFTVSRIEQVPKDRFPSEAVYAQADGAELRVVTCGGSFDAARRSYRDNVIVYAKLTGVSP